MLELQSIDHGLAQGVVVEDHKGRFGVALELLDALLPVLELGGGVEVVVLLLARGVRLEGSKRVAGVTAVEAHIADGRGQERAGGHRLGVLRLVDVAEPDLVVQEGSDSFLRHPRRMAHFGHEGELVEGAAELDQEVAVLGSEAKAPGELHEQRAEFAGLFHGPESFLKLLNVRRLQAALVGEALVELGGEAEVTVGLDLLHPDLGDFGLQGFVEGRIDLDQVYEPGEIFEGVESAGLGLGVDGAVPMRVRPAGGSDEGQRGGHGGRLLRAMFVLSSPLSMRE